MNIAERPVPVLSPDPIARFTPMAGEKIRGD